ncbi:hypothetical protein GQ53DRAFT_603004, partial [Thozetella sp. PMI_491]
IIKLDDITAYDISEDEETLLWELEVDRLIQSAKDTASAVPFEGSAAFPEPNAEASYDGLSGLADQLLVNLHVCRRHQQLQGAKSRQDKLAKEANEWVFEETAIRVNCATYVYTVLALCSALAVGGLMIGIFLGTFVKNSIALQGVDPFGFTTYAWIIAGFIMLIAKNIRVAEWPWRDFLLRRVTCRSLSELHAVTGVDEQDLLVYLLTMEYENVLKTKGPHNSIFMRREPQGFSIDVKPEVRTLLAAGIIFIKVSVRKEPVLICL